MGYRFTLESANTVANLTFGRVMSCYRELCGSEEQYWSFAEFLRQFSRNMYSKDIETLRRSRVLVVCGSYADETVKVDVATAERLHITATTLDGLIAVSEIGHAVA